MLLERKGLKTIPSLVKVVSLNKVQILFGSISLQVVLIYFRDASLQLEKLAAIFKNKQKYMAKTIDDTSLNYFLDIFLQRRVQAKIQNKTG